MLRFVFCRIQTIQNVVDASIVTFQVDFRATIPNWWSPSSYNRLYSCAYRFGLSTDSEIYRKFAKPNTFAALGTAAHRLTERAWSNEFEEIDSIDLGAKISDVWNQEVEIQFQKILTAWAPSKVPPPRDWPFYSISSTRTIKRILNEITDFRARGHQPSNIDRPWVEHELFDENMCLKGTPDRVIFFEESFIVQDLKTGFKIKEMSESHRRQLLLYAHLVRSDTHKRPKRIEVVKSDGQILGENISDADVDDCLQEFRSKTQDFMNSVQRDSVSEDVASPSPEVCGHCHYRPICKSFWADSKFDWSDSRGSVGRVIRVSNNNTLTLEQIYPSDCVGEVIEVSNVHQTSAVGDIVSIVNAYKQGSSLRGRWNTILTTLRPADESHIT